MKKLVLSLFVSAVAIGCCSNRCCCRYSKAPHPRYVVAMIFDGLAGYTVTPESMPTVCELMKEGSWTLKSRSILPSASSLNWHSLFTCSASEQHGYIAWDTRSPKFEVMEKTERGLYPDIFYALEKQRPEAKSFVCCEWEGILYTIDTNACTSVYQKKKLDAAVDVCEVLKNERPAIIAACYNDPDHTGHAMGWNSPEYIEMLKYLDSEVAKVVKSIKDLGIEDDTVLIISADHGGKGTSHGGPTELEMFRPFVAVGLGIKKNYEMSFPGTVYDDGATMAALLGLKPFQSWIGRPRIEIFE